MVLGWVDFNCKILKLNETLHQKTMWLHKYSFYIMIVFCCNITTIAFYYKNNGEIIFKKDTGRDQLLNVILQYKSCSIYILHIQSHFFLSSTYFIRFYYSDVWISYSGGACLSVTKKIVFWKRTKKLAVCEVHSERSKCKVVFIELES